ncbi:unnamed protein product [Allacma fusca]|uniref:Uncharacterized protein n=1 Tax=Allacma fusca TaxID=39272 RepID=A0A8J2JI48_9HEXA|nr:unnamed protein product [Allacma fusca]
MESPVESPGDPGKEKAFKRNSKSGSTSNSNCCLPKRKLVIVGDGGSGKTSLLHSYTSHVFCEEYVPTVFENYVTEIYLENHLKKIELALWDTAGQEDFDRLRPLSYPEADVILLCFSISDPLTLTNIAEKWCPEVSHFCDSTPLILVGLKKDLRNDPLVMERLRVQNKSPVQTEEGMAMASRINALCYLECSAKTREGIHAIFNQAAQSAFKYGSKKKRRKLRCSIL